MADDSSMQDEWLHPYYLGPYAENDHLLERYLLTFIRDHVFWRRNLHPEDPPVIPTSAQYSREFTDFSAKMAQELHRLSSELKRSVPWFSPRYLGHMSSDLLLPGLLAQLLTTLYNPNNVVEDSSPATLNKELEVGRQLAELFGFNTDPTQYPCAWGHLTSGGTVANYESLWQFRSVKFYPLALRDALRTWPDWPGPQPKDGLDYRQCSNWDLLNLSIAETLAWRRAVFQALQLLPMENRRAFFALVKSNRFENLGTARFFRRHQDVEPPVVLLSSTAHYSWEKAMKILGLGTEQLLGVRVDERMRLDAGALDEALAHCQERKISVLACVGILGTTEFGTIDPIAEIVALRRKWSAVGLDFAIHVDAAFGGYMRSVFLSENGSFLKRGEMRKSFVHFPSRQVHAAFAALPEVDSVTVDPHKLGYLPYPSGAFVSRNRELGELIAQDAPYVFDLAEGAPVDFGEKLKNLGKYILEGSKPGASAAAAYVTHRVLPLHRKGMGRIIAHTIRSCETLHEALLDFADQWKDRVLIAVPFEPETNLICLALNPLGNPSVPRANAFGRAVFQYLRIRPELPLQNGPFFASFTSLLLSKTPADHMDRLCARLGLDRSTLHNSPDESGACADHLFLLRHTLMNPWSASGKPGQTYLDKYLNYLGECLRLTLTAPIP